ncbi:hypothetical protein [Actinoplanes sp. NPDC051494]|uniref:hypothetical protein n=1 Tax=Actinoplanes sp. NPDC051494 TaxID=3363907 RepID=UPI003794FDEA
MPVQSIARERRIGLAIIAVLVTAVLIGVFGLGPGPLRRDGPLDGGALGGLAGRVQPTDQGVLWGAVELHNGTDHTVVVDEVTLTGVHGLTTTAGPFVWDGTRYPVLGAGSVAIHGLPLPGAWDALERHSPRGYRIRPRTDDTIEILYEFAVPARDATLDGLTVSYHIGPFAYRRYFPASLKLCPSAATVCTAG